MQNRLPPRKTSQQNLHMLYKKVESIIDEMAELYLNHTSKRIEFHNTEIIELKYHISQAFSNYDKLISPPIRQLEGYRCLEMSEGYSYLGDGLKFDDDDIPF